MVHLILGIIDNGIFDAKDYMIEMILLTNPLLLYACNDPRYFFAFMSSQILSISQCCSLSVSKKLPTIQCVFHIHIPVMLAVSILGPSCLQYGDVVLI